MPSPSDNKPDSSQPNDFANAVNAARQNATYKPVTGDNPVQSGTGSKPGGDGDASWFPKQPSAGSVIMSSVQSPQPSEVQAMPAPQAGGAPPPMKHFGVDPQTGRVRISPYFYAPQSIMEAKEAGVLPAKQASDWIKAITPGDDEGADDNKVGAVKDFMGRVGVKDAQVLNTAAQGVTGMFGRNGVSDYFKKRNDLLDQAADGRMGGGADIINPSRNLTWGGFAGDTTGTLLGNSPTMVAGGGLGSLAKVGFEGTQLATLGPEFASQLPSMIQALGTKHAEAYNQAIRQNKSPEEADADAHRETINALPQIGLPLAGNRAPKVYRALIQAGLGKVGESVGSGDLQKLIPNR